MSDNNDILNEILNEASNDNTSPEAADESPEAAENFPTEKSIPAEEYAPETYAGTEEEEPLPRRTERDPRRDNYGRPPVKKGSSSKHKKKKKKKRKRSRLPGVLILVTLIFGVSIISSIIIIGYGKDMLGIGKSDQTHLLVIPEDATTEEIALMLQTDGIIKSSEAFKLFANFRQSDMSYVSGEHFVRPNMPYETLIDELTKVPTEEMGESIQVTFPEGVNLIEASLILEENGICDADDFIFYFNSGGFGVPFEDRLPLDTSLKFERMEGYLFPDTYFFYQNSDPQEVCQKIYYNFDLKMTSERLEKMEKLNLSLDQLITFASIVQKEAATTDTMVNVASVFWNRLENADTFPLLQSDPTSNYSNDVIRPNMEYYDQVKIDAYDTYKSPGLPPGPICSPGLDAIDAVLEKYQSNWFYFIANINTKETYFSETLEEHEQNQAMIEEQYAQQAAESDE